MSVFQRPQLLGNKPTSVLCQSFDHILLFGLNGYLRNSAATSSSSGIALAKGFETAAKVIQPRLAVRRADESIELQVCAVNSLILPGIGCLSEWSSLFLCFIVVHT